MKVPLIKQGWLRALIFLITWLMLQFGLATLVYKLLLEPEKAGGDPSNRLLLTALIGLAINVPAVWIFRKLIDRRSFASLGFYWQGNVSHAVTGFLSALLIFSLGTLVLLSAGFVQFVDTDFNGRNIATYLFIMMLIAVSEEIVVRGYILNNLLDSFPKWVSLLISAGLFASLHLLNPGFNWLGMAGIFAGGILLGLNYIYTRNLWFGIFLHLAWNFLQGPVLGYHVSGLETESLFFMTTNGPSWITGGEFGFEASAPGTLLVLATAVWLQYLYRRKNSSLNSSGI